MDAYAMMSCSIYRSYTYGRTEIVPGRGVHRLIYGRFLDLDLREFREPKEVDDA